MESGDESGEHVVSISTNKWSDKSKLAFKYLTETHKT
jgi:hypothetical protein